MRGIQQGDQRIRWAHQSRLHRLLCGILATLQLAFPVLVSALPIDGQVAGGQATIQQPTSKSLTVQQASDKAILNWKSFSIAADEAVRFVQPSINSIALNRVTGIDPSVILGSLQANGRIFLLNPNGILFGAGSQVNVGGLLATTLQIRDDDFMAGRYLFAQDPLKGLKSVVNRGTIHVSDHGFVVLAAPGVANDGVIVANLGTTLLGSGQKLTIDLMGDGLINYALSDKVLSQVMGPDGRPLSSAVSNSGTIRADGGTVILQAKASGDIFSSVVNQSGVVRARSLEQHGGVVKLIGGEDTLVAATAAGAMRPAGEVSGAVVNTGTIDVSAGLSNATQGSVTMLGERVGQFGSIQATGAEGATGGEVVIASATRTLLASGSTIDVSGVGHSSGGRLRVWSDQDTFFNAGSTILARGGDLGGNGGLIELSGKENLGFAGTVNALAPLGRAGTLLLDPRNITIATAGGSAYNPGGNNLFGNTPAANVIITPASINAAAANVVLQANNDITVTNAIAMTTNGVGLTMQAGRDINISANVTTTNGNISLTANDAAATGANRLAGTGDIVMAAGTTLNAGNANISLRIDPSAVAPFSPGGITAQALTTTAGTISLQSTAASTVAGAVSLGTGSLSLNNAGAMTISGVINGASGLTKIGAGTLTLSGANTYTGATTINAGTLTLGAANRIADTSAVTVAGGATFNLNNFAETIGSLAGAGNVTVGTGTLTTGGNNTSTTYSGVMSGTGGLTKAGTGTMTLSGVNTYSGTTTINAGTLQVAGGTAISDSSAVTLANAAGATLDLNGTSETIGSLAGGGAAGGNVTLGAGTLTTGVATNTTYSGVISGTGGLTKQGIGAFTLSGANTYTGATTIIAGTLTLGAADRIADASAVVLNAGTFNLNNFSETIGSLAGAGAVSLGTGPLSTGGNNTSTTYSGVMSGTGGLTKLGTGTLTLSGANTYTGTTNVNTGGLQLGAANRIADTSAVTVAGGATFNLNNFAETIGSLAGAGNVPLGTGTLTTGGNNTSTTYSGVMSGTGGLTKAGTGTMTLSGVNTYSGTTTINAGTLQVAGGTAISDSSAVTLANAAGATLDLNGTSETIGSLAGGGAAGGNVTLGAGTLTTGGNNTSTTYSGILSGTGGLTKAGTGTFTLSGANTYTGATTINAGTLTLGAANRIADTSAVTVAGGATFNLNNFAETIGSLAGAGNVPLGTGTLTTGGNNTSTTYSGVMSGTGRLTKAGTGTMTLSGVNTYTGTTNVNAGTLVAAVNNALGTVAGATTVASGATLGFSGGINYATAEPVTLNSGAMLSNLAGNNIFAGPIALAAGTETMTTAGGTTLTANGIVSGAGALMKDGSGTLIYGGANTYTGSTTINAGTLQLGAANRIVDTNAVTVAGGATFNLNNFAETIGSLSGGGNVTLGSATLTTGDATNTTFSGVMSGTGGLTKQGTGTFTLSGANTYTGTTTINAGTLQIASGAAIADSSAVTLANVAGATLDLNGTNETIGSLAGGGALGGNVLLGTGSLTTGGNNTSTTYSGILSGTGGLTKAGTGTFTLSGANTYTGATTINAGTLTLGAANRIADTSAVTVAGGATFNLNNFAETIGSLAGAGNVSLGTATLTTGGDNTSTTYSGLMSGAGGLTKLGTGTLTLSGANTYSGTTNVNVGTLIAAVNNALGTVAGGTTVAAGAALGFSGGINYATAEPVTLNGGTLANVAGNNTFAGPITLTANSAITVADGTTMTIGGTVNGGSQLNVTSGTGGINFLSAIGGITPLSSLTATVGSISLGPVTTVGTQTYTGTTTLNGNLTTTNSAITLNSPVTLGANTALNAGGGAILFGNTVNGAFNLTANSTGTTTFGGAVGNSTALTSLTTNAGGTSAINGGSVTTSGNQTYNDHVTMNQATTLASTGGTITFGGNATNNAAGAALTVDAPTINLTGGTTIATTANGPISFFTNTLNPNGANINAGTAAFTLSPNTLTNTIEFGDVNTGRVTDVYYGSNFGSVTAGSFTVGRPTHTGNIFVTGVAVAPISLNIVNGGTGSVTFETAPYVSGNRDLGVASGSGGISLGSNVALGSGTLRLTTTGAIAQSSGGITADTAGLSSSTGISLSQPTNNVVTLAAQSTTGNISFTDTNGFSIGSVSASVDGFHPAITGLTANAGAIALQSGGSVTQTQRILASTLSLQGSGPYTLTNAANHVTTLTASTTDNVQYNDASALVLGASTVTGNVDLTTGGAITQSGAVTVTGTTTLGAGAGNDITLTNASNNFSTVSIASGNNVALTDANALDLGASTVSGNLNVTTNGALTQSGALAVAGTTTLATGAANDISLTNAGNNFGTVGITSGNNVALTDTNTLNLAGSTVSGNLALTTGGALSQSGALTVAGGTTFTATAANSDILLDSQANNFGGALAFAGTQTNFRDVQLRNVNGGATVPVLAGLTNLRNLTLTFDNAPITLPALTAGGDLNLTAGGSINQSGVLAVGGTTTLATTVAGSDMLLDTQPNNLGSAVSFGGTLVNIRDIGLRNVNPGATIPSLAGLTNLRNLTLTFDNAPIALPGLTLTAGGNLNVTAGGSISQTGAITVLGTTTLTTTVAGSDIQLETQANNLGGTVSFGGVQSNIRDIGLRNLNAAATVPALAGATSLRNLILTFDNAPIVLPSLTAGGNATVTAGGAITQTGAVTVAGATTLAAGASDITLTNGGNDFNTLSITTGNTVSVTDANALTLAASTVNGNLNVTTNGVLTQSGALTVAGTTTLAAGAANDITLTNGGNDFSTVGITSGNNVALTDVNALTMSASTVGGSFSVSAADLTIAGGLTSTGGSLNLTGTNTVTQSADLIANGANSVMMTTTTGAIAMAPGATSTSGTGAINYTAGTDVTLGSLNTGGGVAVIANGGSVLSAAGSGTNVTAGANSSLQAFNGVVGTQAVPLTVNVNPGTLSIRATTAISGISAFLTGTVLPGSALALLNVPPGAVCFNTCPISSGTGGLAGLLGNAFGSLAYLNRDAIVPAYYQKPSGATSITQVAAEYVPGSVMAASDVNLIGDQQSVARALPPCVDCIPRGGILAAPSEGVDPEASQPGKETDACRQRDGASKDQNQGKPSKSPASGNGCK